MASIMVLKFASLAIMFMILGTDPFCADAALECGRVQFTVAPCLGYIRNPSPSVPGPCCNGIRTLNNLAKTTPDRQGACRCLKSTYLSLPGINVPALSALPTKCGVNLPFKPTPTIDCNTVR